MSWLIVILLSFPVHSLDCFTTTGYQLSVEGVQCAECQFLTHLDATTLECAIPVLDVPTDVIGLTSILTDCDNDDPILVYCTEGTECVVSEYRTRCVECNGWGFIRRADDGLYDRMVCECYSARLNPVTGCQQTQLDQNPLFQQVTVSGLTKTKISCESFQSTKYGCFKAIDSSNHEYGTPLPPIPTQCCHENFGPPPGELLEALSLEKGELVEEYEACNRKGGIDPDTNNLPLNATTTLDENGNLTALSVRGFRVCHGHGQWNLNTRECECYTGWDLGLVGSYNGTDLLSCVQCATFYGPDVSDPLEEPPYCSKIYTPWPKTGEPLECGGGGSYVDGRCNCFGNQTHGFWALVNLTRLETTVETCGVCVSDCP